nr:MAG TPA: hypothetical protein [Caudoviricetes sp.]
MIHANNICELRLCNTSRFSRLSNIKRSRKRPL